MIRHLLTLTFFVVIGVSTPLLAQLPDGSIAPDWTLTDINGTTHTLYDYLEQGKMVIIEFSATWCGPCWNYMQTGALEAVWEEHGPNGDNTVMMFYIEADFSTGMADLLGETASSQGNWVASIPFPIIDLQPGQNTASQYQIAYYPTLFAACSDVSLWEVGQASAATWSSFITSCTLSGEIENIDHALCGGDGSITAGYEGGVAPITYLWNTGYTGSTLSNIGAGTYSVKIKESGGKFVLIEDIVVTGPDSPVGLETSSIEQPLCNGSSNGGIDIEIEGGTPGYAYDWSNGSTAEDLTNVSAGSYSVVVTDDNGCTFTEAFVVDEPDELLADNETTPENCEQEDGTITLFIEGGTGPFEITCTSGIVFGNQVINLSEGLHTATVEDDHGCVWQETIEIEALPAPEAEISQGPDITCMQSSTTLTAFASSGSGDYEYEWWTTDGNIVGGNQQQTITVDAAGTYHLLVTDFVSSCEVTTSSIVTPDIVLPEVTAGLDLPITCEANQVTILGAGDPLNTITWTTENGNIVSGGDTYTPVVDAPGIYQINVYNTVTGCTNIDQVEILDQLSPATAAFQYQTNSLTIITTDLSSGSNLSGWTWSFGDGATSNDPSPVHTYQTEGTYQVCLSVQNGCGVSQSCSQVEVVFVGSVLSLNAQVIDVDCNGNATGAIILGVNGGSGNYTYSWTGPGGVTFETPTILDLYSGTYLVTVMDDQGNSILGGFTVEQPATLQIGSSAVVDNICFGQNNGSITVELAGGVAPYLYSWNGGPQQPENSITSLPGGSYECFVTDANGCNLAIGPYAIFEPAELVSESAITQPLCHGDANGSILLAVNGGIAPYAYQWAGTGHQTQEVLGLTAGNYSCIVTDANGCNMEVQVSVGEPDALQVNVAEVTDATGAGNSDGSVTIQVLGGTEPYAVTWSNGATGLSIQGLLPGEYSYTIVDGHGCSYQSPAPVVVGTSVATTDPEEPVYVTLTPNPSNGNVIIQWEELTSDKSSLSIMTIDGRRIGSKEIDSHKGKWDISHLGLTEGIYIVFLRQDHKVIPFKLIVL